jgi:hypothetical protein
VGDGIPVLTYSDLIGAGVLNVLLSSPENCCIFLVRQTEQTGHWCMCFLKNNGSEKGIHIYDSYGNPPDGREWSRYLTQNILQQLHQEKPYLLNELYNSGYKVYFNEHRHQGKDPRIQTCGRHCAIRCSFLDLDSKQYDEMITNQGVNPDELVCDLTNCYL